MKPAWIICMIFALQLGGVSILFADQHESRQHGSHLHGQGKLNLVMEGKELRIELEIPAIDIVGFEHKARTEAETQQVQQAIKKLKESNKMFGFDSNADCHSENIQVNITMLNEAHDEHEHDEHAHDEHEDEHKDEHAHGEHEDEHKDEHAHDEHEDEHKHDKEEHAHDEHEDEHKDEHAHEKHEDEHKHDKDEHAHGEHEEHADEMEESHSEVHAMYEFHCENPDALKAIQVHLMREFKTIAELDVQMVTATRQTSSELTQNDIVIRM